MNIHPLIVHFPIALLAVYSLLEILSVVSRRLRTTSWAHAVKTFLILTGVVAAVAALITGGLIEDAIRESNPRAYILSVHAPVAALTTLLYLILAAAYVVRLFDRRGWSARIVGRNRLLNRVLRLKRFLAGLVLDTWVRPVVATLAFFGLLVTGALGAAMVFGPNVDPFVSLVYYLVFVH